MTFFRGKSAITPCICPRNKKERALQAMVPGFVPPDGGTLPQGPAEDSPLTYRIVHGTILSRKIVPKSLKIQGQDTGFEPVTLHKLNP